MHTPFTKQFKLALLATTAMRPPAALAANLFGDNRLAPLVQIPRS